MLGMSVKVMDVLLFANQFGTFAVPGGISMPSLLIFLTDTDCTRAPSQDLPLRLTVPMKFLMGRSSPVLLGKQIKPGARPFCVLTLQMSWQRQQPSLGNSVRCPRPPGIVAGVA